MRLGRKPLAIGRHVARGGLRVDDQLASRVHARVERGPRPQQHILRDCDSHNGTRVNGSQVEQHVLEAGDLVRIGDTVLLAVPLSISVVGWSTPTDSRLVGCSTPLRSLWDDIQKVATTDIDVLIVGETGTGKELVASEIHRASRRPGQMVTVNCAAIASSLAEAELFGHTRRAFSGAEQAREGLVRRAHRGTLLLDEVADLPYELQAKLLRVLATGQVRPVGSDAASPVDVRIIAATNRDLSHMANDGSFRLDLYMRIAQWTVRVPPLRDRRRDLRPIAESMLASLALSEPVVSMSGDFFEALALHDWPGNVRELLHTLRAAAVRCGDGGELTGGHLPEHLRRSVAGEQRGVAAARCAASGALTCDDVDALLRRHRGNVSAAASEVGRSRMQVYRWLERYGLRASDYRRAE